MRAPWHLWLTGVAALLWNAGGAFDYYMMKTSNAAYQAQLSPAQRAFYDDYPFWVNVAWALGVWGAVAGAILLLLRSRFAIHAFAISLTGMAGNLVWGYFVSPTPMSEVMGEAGLFPVLFTFAIALVGIALLVYAMRMAQRGVLR
jgi:hypothetical protein